MRETELHCVFSEKLESVYSRLGHFFEAVRVARHASHPHYPTFFSAAKASIERLGVGAAEEKCTLQLHEFALAFVLLAKAGINAQLSDYGLATALSGLPPLEEHVPWHEAPEPSLPDPTATAGPGARLELPTYIKGSLSSSRLGIHDAKSGENSANQSEDLGGKQLSVEEATQRLAQADGKHALTWQQALEMLLSSPQLAKAGLWAHDFLGEAYCENVTKRLKKQRTKLRKLFQYYSGLSAAKSKLTIKEVQTLATDCQLHINYAMENSACVLPADISGFFDSYQQRVRLTHVNFAGKKKAAQQTDLFFPQFLEVLVGLAAMRYPNELTPLSERVHIFVTKDLNHAYKLVDSKAAKQEG